MYRWLAVFTAMLVLVTGVTFVSAQEAPHGPADPPTADAPAAAPWVFDSQASPQAAMFKFLEAMGHIQRLEGDTESRQAAWQRVLACLDVSKIDPEKARVAAEQLLAVLDKLGTVKPEDLHDADSVAESGIHQFTYFPAGKKHLWVWDQLEVFGKFPDGEIQLEETTPGQWQFSGQTIAGVGLLYESMESLPPKHLAPRQGADEGEIVEVLGPTFTRTEPWNWGVLLLGIFLGLAVGKLVQTGLRGISRRMELGDATVRATVFRDAAGPASLALLTTGVMIGLFFIYMKPELRQFTARLIIFLYILAGGWFLFNLVDLIDLALRSFAEKTESQLDDMIVPLVRKTLRIFLVILIGIVVLQNVFQLNITGFLASLGIAGLAVSLAAQDSVKNLFGSITVFFDKPFAVGDMIVFGGHRGTVEEIGFRSTRIRLLSGHLVTVPNMKFIDNDVENISARPFIRREMNVTITYDTAPPKIDEAVHLLRTLLHDPEVVEQGRFDLEEFPPRIAFNELNADSLNIRAYYWYQFADDPDRGFFTFLDHCQLVNTKLFRAYGEAGIDFAFPTQTLYLAGDADRRISLEAQISSPADTRSARAYT